MDDRVLLHFKRMARRRRRSAPQPVGGLRVTLVLTVLFAACLISLLELRLRPVVEQLAARQVNNHVTARLNAALSDLEGGAVLNISRDGQGNITALSGNMEQINRLRGQVVRMALDTVSAMDVHTLGVPVGSLFDFDLLWAKGPVIRVHGLVAGTVTADLRSEFRAAGINQTLHRLVLDVEVPLTVLLPGSRESTVANVSLCVAETVIVGKVPDTYLNLTGGQTNAGQTGSAIASAGTGAGGL